MENITESLGCEICGSNDEYLVNGICSQCILDFEEQRQVEDVALVESYANLHPVDNDLYD